MFSSLILSDLADDRQQQLIAAADAHRTARLARVQRLWPRTSQRDEVGGGRCSVAIGQQAS
jgi:hypothetical protein